MDGVQIHLFRKMRKKIYIISNIKSFPMTHHFRASFFRYDRKSGQFCEVFLRSKLVKYLYAALIYIFAGAATSVKILQAIDAEYCICKLSIVIIVLHKFN